MSTFRCLHSLVPMAGTRITATLRSSSALLTTRTVSTRSRLHEWDNDDKVQERNCYYLDVDSDGDELLLDPPSFRPYATYSPQFKFPSNKKKKKKQQQQHQLAGNRSLEEFIQHIPTTIRISQQRLFSVQDEEDSVTKLFRSLHLDRSDWESFAIFDPTLSHTSKLIATDGETFALVLSCWNDADSDSTIDGGHPYFDACRWKVLQGQVQVCRYGEQPGNGVVALNHQQRLRCIVGEEIFREGEVSFVNYSVGLRKVSNASKVGPAVTLQLYSSAFDALSRLDDVDLD